MRADLEHDLISKYPSVFKNVFLSTEESPMAFGIECGEGWFELINKLCSDLNELGVEVVADQVKEKFGGLRFYCHISGDKNIEEAWDLITEAEDNSYYICEICGKPGSLSTNGHWLKTMCITHRTALDYKSCKEESNAQSDD